MNAYLIAGSAIVVLLLTIYIVILRGDVKALEIELEVAEREVDSLIATNKATQRATGDLQLEYNRQIDEFAKALAEERKAHNQTKELVLQIEQQKPVVVSAYETCSISDKGDAILDKLNTDYNLRTTK